MFKKDEKGYVMSGIGFLLLTSVLIMIPIVLSVQDQSSNIPNTFVKSDVITQTLRNIQNDLDNQMNLFASTIHGATFNYSTSSNSLLNNITSLYHNTNNATYFNSFGSTVDNLNMEPIYSSSDVLQMNRDKGIIPLKNGIELSYSLIGASTVDNYIIYNYSMNITGNITLTATKFDVGQKNTFTRNYGGDNFIFYVNSTTINPDTAQSNVDSFFSQINQALSTSGYCKTI